MEVNFTWLRKQSAFCWVSFGGIVTVLVLYYTAQSQLGLHSFPSYAGNKVLKNVNGTPSQPRLHSPSSYTGNKVLKSVNGTPSQPRLHSPSSYTGKEVQKNVNANNQLSCRCKIVKQNTAKSISEKHFSRVPGLEYAAEEELGMRHPNFPVDQTIEMSQHSVCHLMSSPISIRWFNTYWQEAQLQGSVSFLVYSAVYDNRTATDIRPCVRILGVSNSIDPPRSWCQLWFNSTSSPGISRIERIDHLDYQKKNKDRQMPYLLSCQIPSHLAHLQPTAVSLVKEPCEKATTLLKVVGAGRRESSSVKNHQETKSSSNEGESATEYEVSVCGPALYYYHEDFSSRLVEWLEILRAQDISRVYLYETDVHPNIHTVLRHYEQEGFIEVTRFSYPPPYVNEPSLRKFWTLQNRAKIFAMENIYFTDCILRHMHQYRFMAHYDPDEIPILPKNKTYPQFLKDLIQKVEVDSSKQAKRRPPPSRIPPTLANVS